MLQSSKVSGFIYMTIGFMCQWDADETLMLHLYFCSLFDNGYLDLFLVIWYLTGVRTLVWPDISSNQQKVELMSARTKFFSSSFYKVLIETSDHSKRWTDHRKLYSKSISQTFYTIFKTWPLLDFFSSKLTACVKMW